MSTARQPRAARISVRGGKVLLVSGAAAAALLAFGATGASASPPASPGPGHQHSPAAHPGPPGVAAFDGTYSGTTYAFTGMSAPQLGISPARLGPGGSATFTTTVTSDTQAAQWNGTTAQLIIAGFTQNPSSSPADPPGRPPNPGHPSTPSLDSYGSLIYAQDNSMGAGYCANDKFFTGPTQKTFIFGTGDACYVHSTPPYGSTETYSVTLYANGTFTDTVSRPHSGVTDRGQFTCTATTCSASFTGTLPGPSTTRYYPALYLLPGRTTTAPNDLWTFTVSASTYSIQR